MAGGCVRDALLGRAPKDFDMASSASPREALKIFPSAKAIEKYGTVLVPLKNPSFRLEITAFRTESPYTDGRRPDSVQPSSMEEDAQRRDFTVNALFYSLRQNRIHDFAGGMADLKQKLLRAVGDPLARFQEDRLRPLRALRLAHQLGFRIEGKTLQAAARSAPLLKSVSRERIADEMRKMLSCGRMGEAIRLLNKNGFIGPVFFPFPPSDPSSGSPSGPSSDLPGWEPSPPDFPKNQPSEREAAFWDQEFSPWEDFRRDEAFLWTAAGMPYFFSKAGSKADQGLRFQRFLKNLKLSAAAVKKSLSYFHGAEALVLRESSFLDNMLAFEGQKAPVKALCLAWLNSQGLSAGRFDSLLREFERREGPNGRLPPPLLSGKDLLQRGLAPGRPLGRLLKKAFELQMKNPEAGKAEILKSLSLPAKPEQR